MKANVWVATANAHAQTNRHHVSTHQLLTVIVALNNAVIGDANWNHQHVTDGARAQRVHYDGQHACARQGRLTAAGASALQVDLQKLLLSQQLLCVLDDDR